MIELNALIRSKLDEAGEAVDVTAIVQAVKAEIVDFEEAFDVMIPRYVGDIIRLSRRAALCAITDDATPQAPPAPRPIATATNPGRSRRAISCEAWRSKLDVLVSVEGHGTMKRLGACTCVDVQKVAQLYQQRSAANAEYARWYTRLAQAMAAEGASTVADLAERTLRPLLERAA